MLTFVISILHIVVTCAYVTAFAVV